MCSIWLTLFSYSCMNLNLGSVGGFLPTIIKGFGKFFIFVVTTWKYLRLVSRLLQRPCPIIHGSSLRRRPCIHAHSHFLFRLASNSWSPRCLRFLPWYHRLGHPPHCPCSWTLLCSIFCVYLHCHSGLHQYPVDNELAECLYREPESKGNKFGYA